MKPDAQYRQNEPLEPLPTTRPGNKVVRRRRKIGGKLHTISQGISRFFKGMAGKYRGTR